MASPSEQAAWRAVGRLNVTGQGYCTGTLVAPDLVLTAAHCVVNRRTGSLVAPEKVHFLAGFRIGKYAAHGIGKFIAVPPGYNRARKTVNLDMALVQLREPVPPEVEPARLTAGVRSNAEFTLLSYGMDRAQILSSQQECRFEKRQATILFTTCEGIPGVSGGPLMQQIDGQFVMVGIASSIVAKTRVPLPTGSVVAVEVTQRAVDLLLRLLDEQNQATLRPNLPARLLK